MNGIFIDGPWKGKTTRYSHGISRLRVPYGVHSLNNISDQSTSETWYAVYEITNNSRVVNKIEHTEWKFIEDTFQDGSPVFSKNETNKHVESEPIS